LEATGLHVPLVDPVGRASLSKSAVEHEHLGLHAEGDRGGVHAGDARADDDDLGRVDTRTLPRAARRVRPCARSRLWRPTCGAMRPATSDIGASSGSAPSAVCTVS
jgi:hypothetical protein